MVAAVNPATRTGWLVGRSFDAREFNRILNDPAVYPFVTLPHLKTLDASPLVDDPRNFLLMADGGGIIFHCLDAGVYEVHTAFLKPDREKLSQQGPHIRNACLEAYRFMFTHSDCVELLTKIPAHNRAATIFAPLVGWTKEYQREAVWPTPDGNVGLSYWSLRYDDWVRKTPDLMSAGRWFHDRLEQECERLGHTLPHHDDDAAHDLHVGSAVEMIYGGQTEKAVILYNRWARFAGYGLIALLCKNPLLIDIGDALIEILPETFKVLKCRLPQA
jgi:hypothetical protein